MPEYTKTGNKNKANKAQIKDKLKPLKYADKRKTAAKITAGRLIDAIFPIQISYAYSIRCNTNVYPIHQMQGFRRYR